MKWWRDKLYVGTNHSFFCAQIAALNKAVPTLIPYPPQDPDIACTPNSLDLDLRAEIWRWTPQTDMWERIYQSPNDLAIPGEAGKVVARDIGYRDISIVQEPNGTEALYVSGVSARFIGYQLPPPRILRSTDGSTFTALPQDPGTVLGDLPGSSFRDQAQYKGHFFIIGGSIQGSGTLYEAANPAMGGNAFAAVSPVGMAISAIEVFAGHLYVGVYDSVNGYAVYRTDAIGPLPYQFTPVVTKGGSLPTGTNTEVLCMIEFNGRLYVGTSGITVGSMSLLGPNPAELIRINSDDSWDLVVGTARDTPVGRKEPLSGRGAGFGNLFNEHIWRLAVFEGQLYVGTLDTGTTYRNDPLLGPSVHDSGADLYHSTNGVTFTSASSGTSDPGSSVAQAGESVFTAVTINGFDDKFNTGIRSLEPTPYGLFVGTTNDYYGLRVDMMLPAATTYFYYMPVVNEGDYQPHITHWPPTGFDDQTQ